MKIIWIDGTFGIGKSAVAAAIVKKIPQAHLLEFDALQEKLYEMIERTRTEREMQVCSFCPCSTMDQLSL